MAQLDPWSSVRLRADFLNLCMGDDLEFLRLSARRSAFLSGLETAGLVDELGLRLRSPAEVMPWIKDPPFGGRLHWHWTAFHAMYPAEFWRKVGAMADGNAGGIEEPLVFLEADPWCFRSGYAKQTIARLIRKVALTEAQRQRLLDALLNGVTKGPRWEFREYCKAARAFSTPEFRIRLRQMSGFTKEPPGTGAEQRARWMLEKVERD
jgi:hypothetical protein